MIRTRLNAPRATRKVSRLNSLHNVVDVLAEYVERLGVDVGVRDERAEVDYSPDVSQSTDPSDTDPSDSGLTDGRDVPNSLKRCSAP